MEKIVVLNSGGFDSVVLLHKLRIFDRDDREIHSLHFHFGALNEKQQQRCVDKVCEKLDLISKVIELPKIDWTKRDFYSGKGKDLSSGYLEYRNLIFLSYAISYAESIGAKEIYTAILKGGIYTDTNPLFFKGLNSFLEPNSGIKIITPFDNLTKVDITYIASTCCITPEDYFSCDTPNENGEPCGECMQCEELKEINEHLTINTPLKAFFASGNDFCDPTFKELLSKEKIYEVRALINNDCQLKCKHCFYGFESMKSEPVSKELYYSALKDFVLKHGVENIHFSGKEPLFDDKILWYAHKIQEDKLPCTFNLVTNGINLPKYVSELKNCGMNRVYLSVDDILNTNGVRSVHAVTDKAIKACNEVDIPVEVFIDIHNNNYNKLENIVEYLESNFKIDRYYVRTIRSIGNAENLSLPKGKELEVAWKQIKFLADKYKDKEFEFSVSIEYTDEIRNTELEEDIITCENWYTSKFRENLFVHLERFCYRYTDTYTLTPDGYLLGCASEVSLPNYDEVSVGNIKDHSIDELVARGREVSKKCNDCYMEKELACKCKYL